MSQPNILFILDDQHRFDCLGCFGNADVKTPHLDAVAAEGVRYENSFCPYPVCTPSRYSMVTGRYVHQHAGFGNHCTPLPDSHFWPKMLREAGYRTACVGKMHYTPTYLDAGFETMLLAEQNGKGRWDDDYHRHLRDLDLVDRSDLEDQEREFRPFARKAYWENFGALPSNLPEAQHSTTWIGDRSCALLEEWEGEGHLLFTSFVKPHHPFDPPARFAEMYDPDALSVLPGWTETLAEVDRDYHHGYFDNSALTLPKLRRVMQHYYATITQIDDQVGRMLDILKKKGLYENTMIVFTSDHGEYMGHRHMLLKGGLMYDPLVKVPLIVRFPDGRRAGELSKQLVSNVDLAPTILEQAGLAPHATMQGLDLAAPENARKVVCAESHGVSQTMARTQRFKLIETDDEGNKGMARLFFDLEADPHETTNRYDDPTHAATIRSLQQAVLDWRGGRASEALPKVYLDEDAPRSKADNVRHISEGHREEIFQWFEAKMRAEEARDGQPQGGMPEW